MSNVDVTQEINIREVDDEEVGATSDLTLGVDSHWNLRSYVILRIGGKSYTVAGHTLKTAIDNAMNTS